MFEENPDISPADAWKNFQELHAPTEASSYAYPTVSKFKRNISAMRTRRKKNSSSQQNEALSNSI